MGTGCGGGRNIIYVLLQHGGGTLPMGVIFLRTLAAAQHGAVTKRDQPAGRAQHDVSHPWHISTSLGNTENPSYI